MNAQRSDSSKPALSATKPTSRKAWKKKTPVEVVIEQEKKLRDQIIEREAEVKDLRRQLQKFEEARKIFETA